MIYGKFVTVNAKSSLICYQYEIRYLYSKILSQVIKVIKVGLLFWSNLPWRQILDITGNILRKFYTMGSSFFWLHVQTQDKPLSLTMPSTRCPCPLYMQWNNRCWCQSIWGACLNSFALTVHKTRGLTLPRVCLALDGNIFSPGQAYVALSRCSSWDNIEIFHLDRFAFMINQDVVSEYQRLLTNKFRIFTTLNIINNK
jgi:hypothetical protein